MKRGFTLVELLVVVAIIVVLLTLLMPAMDKAIDAAVKAQCLSNVRNTVQGCLQYAMENKRTLPVCTMTGVRTADGQLEDGSTAYDLRGPWGGALATGKPLNPMGVGLLVPAGFLPSTKLGKIAHCPTMDNTGGPFPGHCMDKAHGSGYGASGWIENKDYRIINGYNYRAPAYYNAGKGHLKLNKIGSSFLLYVDMPDVRFRGNYGLGQVFVHPDGYSRGFGDGSSSFLLDPELVIEQRLLVMTPGEGQMPGIWDAAFSLQEEGVYEQMSRGSVAQ